MNIDKHKERLKESLEVIEESLKIGLIKRQRTIGFSVSAASSDLLEIYLHKNKLIDPGFIIKHEWFKSKNKLKEKFSFEFENKEEILDLLYKTEIKRNIFCYGVPQEEKTISEVLHNFNKLKKLFQKMGVEIE